jgi:hypothetical protein
VALSEGNGTDRAPRLAETLAKVHLDAGRTHKLIPVTTGIPHLRQINEIDCPMGFDHNQIAGG